MKYLALILLMLCLSFSAQTQYRIEGELIDQHSNETIPGAQVLLLPDSIFTTTNEGGAFEFNYKGDSDSLWIFASFVGLYAKPVMLELQADQPHIHLHLYLNDSECQHCQQVDLVLVEEASMLAAVAQKQELLGKEFMQENLKGNFAQTIAKVAGLNAINVGVGIAKPVIRGLSSNRIQVNQNGIAQQGQQWGNDHGLEIDPMSVERVEIVKGPNSLIYGSDAMGGVINLLPERIAAHNSINFGLQSIYKSNNQHVGASAFLSANYHNYFLQARYSQQDYADYRVPADSFVYNGFVLPIYEQRLKNTAGKEKQFSLSAGMAKPWGQIRWTNSYYGLSAGLFAGAMGIPRAYDLQLDGDFRDIDIPAQRVDHFKSILNIQLTLPKSAFLKVDLGYQQNYRREFALAHLHNRPPDSLAPDNLALALQLQTFSTRIKFKQSLANGWSQQHGADLQLQTNNIAGFDYLIPNFNTIRSGVYSIYDLEPSSTIRWTFGARLDYAYNKTSAYEQLIALETLSNDLTITSPATETHFFNVAAAVGCWWAIIPEKWVLRTHLGKSFRAPYPNETVSNGVHHGNFRHELGQPDLKSEQGYQLDLNSSWNHRFFELDLAAFANFFHNFIYLSPTARFSPLPDAGQLYQYMQTNAIYAGAELTWKAKASAFLSFQQAIDYVWNRNLKTGLGLPFTPPASILSELRVELPYPQTLFERAYLTIGHRYSFAQTLVDRNELPTAGFHLLNLGMGTGLKIKHQRIQISFQAQNLLNQSYLQHLSRYRMLQLPEQGRNFVFSLKIPFQLSLKK